MAAKRTIAICITCAGTGEKKPGAFQMIANQRPEQCPVCEGEGKLRSPKPPNPATQDPGA